MKLFNREPKKKWSLVVESPAWGAVARADLDRVVSDIRQPIVGRYGRYITDVQPFISTDVGKITLGIQTNPITQQQADEMVQFIRALLEKSRP